MSKPLVLAIDQGTTSSRAIVFDASLQARGVSQQEFPQIYPHDGWVEHSPDAIWQTTLHVARRSVEMAEGHGTIAAVGITNQRETVMIWDRRTGKPLGNAIVWQDRRTADRCRELAAAGCEEMVRERTGLLLDPYFSATKIAWILDHHDGAREAARKGYLAAGTVDSWLIWKFTGGRVHATDATNASRTSLYDIVRGDWDDDLLHAFKVPKSLLPEVRNSVDDFGMTDRELLGHPIPLHGVAGDQQAASVGQCCFDSGSIKSTFGTGCFVLLNTGDDVISSSNRLLTTVACQIDGKRTFALEGSIFAAGSTVQWLRDGLGIIARASDSESLAGDLPDNSGVYLVPAFTGLGAPYWRPDARASLVGMTRDTGPAHLARAALESVCYQSRDLLEALRRDGASLTSLRVDGGMVSNNWFLQCLADILNLPIERPEIMETTALGAAYLAGRGAGIWGDTGSFAKRWRLDRRFEPAMDDAVRDRLLDGWRKAVEQTLHV